MSAREVRSLLWEYPRPILAAVVPTALRRLSTNWRAGKRPRADFVLTNNPLPEFTPATLFSDLNLPEVKVVLPPAWKGDDPEPQTMRIEQALRTFAPGRVSRRFGVKYSRIRHWVATADAGRTETRLEISHFYGADLLGNWSIRDGDAAQQVPVFRPFEVRPVRPGNDIGDTSNAFLIWRSQIVASEPGLSMQIPNGSPWRKVLDELTCFRHAEHAPVQVRRFALGSNADIRVKRGEGYRVHFEFVDQGHSAAIGYSLSVDALRIAVRIPDDLWRRVRDHADLERAIRTDRFFDPASTAEALRIVDNPFMRVWLTTVYFSALTQHALVRSVGLAEADAALAAGRGELVLTDVLESLFQSPTGDGDDLQAERESDGGDRLRHDLQTLLGQSDVLDGLRALARCLWEPVDASWESVLRSRFVATIGAAALEAVCDLCPELVLHHLCIDG